MTLLSRHAGTGKWRPSAATYGGFSAASPPPATWQPFAPTSPWRRDVTSATLIANSQEMVDYIVGLGSPMPGFLTSGGEYGHPTYLARTDSPAVTISLSGSGSNNGASIKCPPEALPAPGTDKHMSIIQPDGRVDDFWKASAPSGGKLLATNGGTTNILTGDGFVTNDSATAAGAALWAGVVRIPEMEAATAENFETINHALFVVIKNCREGHIPPAISDDGRGPNEARVPFEGQRLRLALTREQIAALALLPWQKAFLSAMARFGLIVSDKGGPGFGLQFEGITMYTAYGLPDPLRTYGAAHGLPQFPEEPSGAYVYKLNTGPLTTTWWKEHLKAITLGE